jgi:N-acyl-L-homoserine lactone synthetase
MAILRQLTSQVLRERVGNGDLLAGIALREAATEEERRRLFALRYSLYRDEGYIAENPTGLLQDEYDGSSINYFIRRHHKDVGIVRLILDSPHGFWTEAIFNFPRPRVPRAQLGEISRLAVSRHARGDPAIMICLIGTMYRQCVTRDIRHVYMNIPRRFAVYLGRFGFPLREIDQRPPTARHVKARELIAGYFGKADLRPMLVDVAALAAAADPQVLAGAAAPDHEYVGWARAEGA